MKLLFIGGTGTISSSISELVISLGHELYLLNRGNRNHILDSFKKHDNVKTIIADINDEKLVMEQIKDLTFDVVVNFIAFLPSHVERDYRLFANKTRQYIFISSASAYEKPVKNYKITEETGLSNPYWEYSRNKIKCEDMLHSFYHEKEFPITIVRPSHTYDHRKVPTAVHGSKGSYQVIKRMLEGKETIIHGDGTSLWTMTHAKDFAKGFVGLLGNRQSIGEAFHITSDESLTWNQIYETMAKALGVTLKPYYIPTSILIECSDYDFRGTLLGDKTNSVVFDNSKIKKLVADYEASITFEVGIKETIDYLLSQQDSLEIDEEYDLWADRIINKMNEMVARIKELS